MTTLSSSQIKETMVKNGINSDLFLMSDRNYNIPDKNWFFTDFAISLDSLLKFFKTKQWTEENNDCDDFARAGAFLAQTLHSRHKLNTGLAVGEFYFSYQGVAHAINFAIIKENNELKVVFIEPQTGEQLFLDEMEKATCFYWRI